MGRRRSGGLSRLARVAPQRVAGLVLRATRCRRSQGLETPMFDTAIAGSLPKPAWLAEDRAAVAAPGGRRSRPRAGQAGTRRCCGSRPGRRRPDGDRRRRNRAASTSCTASGAGRRHRLRQQVEIGIRNDRYKANGVPQVVAPLRLKGRVHAPPARLLRVHTQRRIKFTRPDRGRSSIPWPTVLRRTA